MKMPDIVVDMNRGDGGDSNQSCRGFVLPCFLFSGSRSTQWLTPSEKKSKGETWKTKTLIIRGNTPQKSTFWATHLIFCSWHDVAHVHVYCPLDLQYNVRHILSCHIAAGQKQGGNNGMGKREASETVSLFSCEYYPEMPFHTAQALSDLLHSTGNFGFRRKGGAKAKPAARAGEIKVWRTVFWINTNTTCLDTATMPTRVWGGNIEAGSR